MPKHIAVLMGGLSPEREVSFSSGKNFSKALSNLGYKVTEIDVDRTLYERLKEIKPDVVFNSLHGTYGEDGVVPAILEMMGIPYTHSGVTASAVGLNKKMTKCILKPYNIRVAKDCIIRLEELISLSKKNKEPLPRPFVIKPVNQGSSVGIYIITNKEEQDLEKVIDLSVWNYGSEVMVEEFIPGIEVSTAVIDNKAIGTLELRTKNEFLNYQAKYTDGITEHIYPARIPEHIYKETLRYAETAHKALGCRSISRSDMRYNPDAKEGEQLYFLEINTHPGFTNTSMVPDIAERNGISREQIAEQLVKDASCEIKSHYTSTKVSGIAVRNGINLDQIAEQVANAASCEIK